MHFSFLNFYIRSFEEQQSKIETNAQHSCLILICMCFIRMLSWLLQGFLYWAKIFLATIPWCFAPMNAIAYTHALCRQHYKQATKVDYSNFGNVKTTDAARIAAAAGLWALIFSDEKTFRAIVACVSVCSVRHVCIYACIFMHA
jgi:hypothetical protein